MLADSCPPTSDAKSTRLRRTAAHRLDMVNHLVDADHVGIAEGP
jgi:hypothetical protein